MKVLHNLPIDLPEDIESVADLPEGIAVFDPLLFQQDDTLFVIDVGAAPPSIVPSVEIKYRMI